MLVPANDSTIGLLLSGGLDSSILLGQLLAAGRRVFVWQAQELQATRRLIQAMSALAERRSNLAELVVLDLPMADVLQDHWSITGRGIPDHATSDDAVYLPGHNALLLVKAALWCQLHRVVSLALASLATNPFSDATAEFFASFQAAMIQSTGREIRIVRPFEKFDKQQVMQLGSRYPLEFTFSCLAPVNGAHCGRCNKCAERRKAFQWLATGDPTCYAFA
jgi:7-cyano-7-deazaguanine synthase